MLWSRFASLMMDQQFTLEVQVIQINEPQAPTCMHNLNVMPSAMVRLGSHCPTRSPTVTI